MGFIPISINEYIKKHLKANPNEDEKDLRNRLNASLQAYKKGIKCSCGNDIWVIGAASVGNRCFTCITGESFPRDDYEIDNAIKKNESKIGRRNINGIDPSKIAVFFDDDGYEVNVELINKPSLCITCIHNDNPEEELLCNITRHDQKNENDFTCLAYTKRNFNN